MIFLGVQIGLVYRKRHSTEINNLVYVVHNEPTVTAVGCEADDFCQIILMMNLLATCLI